MKTLDNIEQWAQKNVRVHDSKLEEYLRAGLAKDGIKVPETFRWSLVGRYIEMTWTERQLP